jgi:hypothetical protein
MPGAVDLRVAAVQVEVDAVVAVLGEEADLVHPRPDLLIGLASVFSALSLIPVFSAAAPDTACGFPLRHSMPPPAATDGLYIVPI